MKLALLFALVGAGSAHVHMATPGALRSGDNPLAKGGNIDTSYNSPLNPDGSNFPCKGYHVDIAGNVPGSESVADWAPGSSQKVTFGTGGAGHSGGSCQVSLSVDGGKTFKVIRSFMGGCPAVADNNGQGALIPELPFTVPKDTPAGSAIFSWTWQNRIGNREMYMNCAHVTITSEGAGSEPVAFDQRPNIFMANLGTVSNGCTTVEGIDVEYPEPGQDPVIAPSAKLGAGKGGSACGKALSDSAPINAPVAGGDRGLEVVPSAAPATSIASAPASGGSPSPGGALTLDPTDLGRCGLVDGVSYTCEGSKHGPFCSSFGHCGNTAEHSGPGCQAKFGKCGGAARAISSTKALAAESSAAPSTPSSFLGSQPSSLASSPSEATVTSSTAAFSAAETTSLTAIVPSTALSSDNTTTTTTPALPFASGNSTTTPDTALQIHPEGKCGKLANGKEYTCVGSGRGCACSSAGWCGVSPAHFGQGCQSAFGTCGKEAASCKVTIQSGVPGNGTAAPTGGSKSGGAVVITSVTRTTIPMLTVTVTESDESPSGAPATASIVRTTLITETKPATSVDLPETVAPVATIVPRFKRPKGSFFDELRNPKAKVGASGTKRPAKPTLGAVFGGRD